MDELTRLLDDVERRQRWPAQEDEAAWATLANWAFQTDCLMTDEAENVAWEATMRELMRANLPYSEFVARRMEALEARLKARKLAQTNLRYRYGFKPSKPHLVRRNVRRFYAK